MIEILLSIGLVAAAIFFVLWLFLPVKKRKPAPEPSLGDPGKKKHIRHDGVERDDDTHLFLLNTNSRYRDEADGKTPIIAPKYSNPSSWEFEITYQDNDGKVGVTKIKNLSFTSEKDPVITALCEQEGAERNFRASRILACVNLESGRAIKDLGTYLKRGYGWR